MLGAVRTCGFGFVLGLLPAIGTGEAVQSDTASPSAFYRAYRSAFETAKTLDDVVPYLAREARELVARLSTDDRRRMFDTLKIMSLMRDVTIVEEVEGGEEVLLSVEALQPEGGWLEGVVVLTREDSVWKVVRETWRVK